MLRPSLGLPRWQGHGAQERMRWWWHKVGGLLGRRRKDPDAILWQGSLLLGLVDLLLSVRHKAATLLGGSTRVVGLGHDDGFGGVSTLLGIDLDQLILSVLIADTTRPGSPEASVIPPELSPWELYEKGFGSNRDST